MNALAVVCFLSAVVCTALASALVARDPGLRLNRLVASIPLAIAYWGVMEALWTIQTDVESASRLIRLSAIGWMSIGPLAFQVFIELAGARGESLRRWVPRLWGLSVTSILLYMGTPWCLGEVRPTSWGFAYSFGPLFPLVYSSTGVPVAFALANWSRVSSDDRAPGERRVSRVIFIGVAVGLTLASLTDVLLPALGAPVPQLSVPVLTGVIVAVAVTLKRFGFSILSPAAFAEEILESLADGVVLLRPNGRIRRANPAFVRLVGLGETDLRDRPLADWVPDWSRSADQTDARWEEGEVEMHLQPAGGPPVPVSVSSCALVRNLGARLGSAVIVRDLRQVAWLRERLVTTGRLAAVGELSAGIAHEIQAPVAKVEQELGALRRHWLAIGSALEKSADGGDDVGELLAEGEELVEECLEGVHRVTSIVADVAGLAEPGATTREPVDVNEVIGRALRMAIPRDARGLAVEQRLDRLPPVLAVAPQLEQVFTNLIRNAVHAVGERGRITVESGWRDGKVEVRVVDDGPGIDPAIRSRIFDPFFTTKPVGEGTGLGLAISYHIVRSHDGQIRAESDGARGAVFTVELPAARGRGAESDEVV